MALVSAWFIMGILNWLCRLFALFTHKLELEDLLVHFTLGLLFAIILGPFPVALRLL